MVGSEAGWEGSGEVVAGFCGVEEGKEGEEARGGVLSEEVEACRERRREVDARRG